VKEDALFLAHKNFSNLHIKKTQNEQTFSPGNFSPTSIS
jgi:hypothetical protein